MTVVTVLAITVSRDLALFAGGIVVFAAVVLGIVGIAEWAEQ